MTSLVQRKQVVTLVDEAVSSGARRHRACEVIGLSIRTLQRWRPVGQSHVASDARPTAARPAPAHRLTTAERERIVTVCNQPPYAHLPPSQIVPKLADQGEYLGSESSFYRVLKAADQVHHRGSTQVPRARQVATTHIAQGPNEVWTWDVTWLPSEVRGRFFYLYLISDLYSRYGVHWEVHEVECGELAAALIEQAIWRERCYERKPILHSDNGGPMKSVTLRHKLLDLGVASSYSRPRVSDDNAFIESLFRTLKHGPMAPPKRFASIEEARQWVARFMRWYNTEHQHSGIRFVTPAQRHRGEDKAILAKRDAVYAAARKANPRRWTTTTRNWRHIEKVALNPDQATRENLDNVA